MKKVISVFCAVILIILSVSVGAYALTAEESQNAVNAAFDARFSGEPGDVDKNGTFSASDARAALLYSAGYTEGADSSKADIDADGIVTAIDARTLLRVSAQLEDESVLSAYNNFVLFNALANSIKAEKLGFRKFTTQQNINISYDNQATIDKFNSQMNKLADQVGDEHMDISEELLKSKNAVSYTYSSGIREAEADNYPVIGRDYASALKFSDIKRIEYKANQSYTFAPKTNYGSNITPVEMTGLDVITVFFNNEKATASSGVYQKCFDVPTNESVMQEYKSLNDMFTGELADMIGTLKASTNHITYRDSFISIYFDRATKKICATDYNLYCDISLALEFNLYNLLFGIDVRNQTVNIFNQDLYKQEYYFIRNYQSLDR